MKKRIMVFLLVCTMALSFAIPAMAASETIAVEPTNVETEQEVTPFHEFTQIAFRTYHGVLQWRVWSLTNGRWLTEWADM